MDSNPSEIEKLIECVVEYGKSGYTLTKLKVIDKTSNIISTLVLLLVSFILTISAIIFASIGASVLIGEYLNNQAYGFFVVALFFLLTATIVYIVLPKFIKKRVCNYIINQVLK